MVLGKLTVPGCIIVGQGPIVLAVHGDGGVMGRRWFRHFLLSLYPRHLCRGVYSFRLDVCPFVCSFVCFLRLFVRSLLSVTFVEFTSKFLVKVSLSEYISLTTHQKAFIFEPWVPERVSFYAMSFGPRVDAQGWG